MNYEIDKSEIDMLKKDLKEVKETVAALVVAVDKLTKVCSRMDDHIDFVEDTYNNLKHPLNFAKTKIERIMGYSQSDTNLLK